MIPFNWPLRLIAYVLAAAAMIGLLRQTDTVVFQPGFIAFLDQLKGIIDLGYPLDILQRIAIEPSLIVIRDVFRSVGWQLPELQDHWRQIFVLIWLSVGTQARHYSISTESVGEFGLAARLTVAALGSLPFSVAAGLFPFGFGSVLIASMGFMGFFGLYSIIIGNWRDSAIWAKGIVSLGFLGISFGALESLAPAESGSIALFLLLCATVAFSAYSMLEGLRSEGNWKERLTDADTLFGADVLAATGLAFSAVVFLSDPPWVRLWF